MKKSWNITEKIIATFIQAWSIFYLYSLVEHLPGILFFVRSQNVGLGYYINTFLINYGIGILGFIGGVALLYEKKWGWVSCELCMLCFAILMLVTGREGLTNEENKHVEASVSYVVAALAFLGIFVLLAQKPYRVKYKPTFINWLVIAGITVAVLAAKSVL